MKFLVTNDDGIDAPGLAALIGAAGTLGEPVVVAPADPQSGVSHAVTWLRRCPDRATRRAAFCHSRHAGRLHAARSTPSGAGGRKWILSGINHGANLGADIYYSGTVAAVREGASARLAGDRFLALPQERGRIRLGAGAALDHTGAGGSSGETGRAGSFLQRQPAPAPARGARSGSRLLSARSKTASAQLPARGRKRPLFCRRLQPAAPHSGRDVDVCFAGNIALTAVRLL